MLIRPETETLGHQIRTKINRFVCLGLLITMVTVSKSITIDARPAVVFAFLDEPSNHVRITPGLSEIRNVERLENGGKRFDHTFGMAGISLDGAMVQTVHDPPKRMMFEMRGTLSGEIGLLLEPDGDGTTFTYRATYDIPGRVLEAVSTPLVRTYNERTLRRTVENVRDAIEAEQPLGA